MHYGTEPWCRSCGEGIAQCKCPQREMVLPTVTETDVTLKLPLQIDRVVIAMAAKAAGMVRSYACCDTPDKYCNSDEWRGNMEAFAENLVNLVVNAYQEGGTKCR